MTKTSELIGAELHLWVAKAEECSHAEILNGNCYANYGNSMARIAFSPSTHWQLGGPLIEKYRIGLDYGTRNDPDECAAFMEAQGELITLPSGNVLAKGYGETPLIAAMRCRVASFYGDEVE